MADERELDRDADEARYGDYREGDSGPDDDAETAVSSGGEPDVLLDVPNLKVDEINLEVEDLRAKVSLQAEVLDLVKLNVGADVHLGRVALEIKGVEAQALLKVRLDNVASILERVLSTIDRNPQILENLTDRLGAAAHEVGEGAGSAVREVGAGAGGAAESVGEGAGSAVREVGAGAGSATENVGEGVERAAKDVGDTARTATGGAAQREGRTTDRAGKRRSGPEKRSHRPRSSPRERP